MSDEKRQEKVQEDDGLEKDLDAETEEEDLNQEEKGKSGGQDEQVESQSAEMSKEDEDLQSRYMRLAADFQNFKRRVEKEKSDIYSYANEKIAVDLLEVMDNFERAILHAEDSSDKNLQEGMNMIFKQLNAVLEKNNIEEIDALGEEFDPNFHNAVMMEASEEYTSGKVSQVLQKGYLLNGKVIRPAMVKVAQ